VIRLRRRSRERTIVSGTESDSLKSQITQHSCITDNIYRHVSSDCSQLPMGNHSSSMSDIRYFVLPHTVATCKSAACYSPTRTCACSSMPFQSSTVFKPDGLLVTPIRPLPVLFQCLVIAFCSTLLFWLESCFSASLTRLLLVLWSVMQLVGESRSSAALPGEW
jgi:hypothetical protein